MLTVSWHDHKLDSVGAKADALSPSYPGTRLIAGKPSFKDKGKSAFYLKSLWQVASVTNSLAYQGSLKKKTPLAKNEGLLNAVQQIPLSVS